SRPGRMPSTTPESLWQTPHALTLIRTSPARGWGISRSTNSSGPPRRGTCTARIFAMTSSFLTAALESAMATDQSIRRRIVRELGLGLALELGDDALRELFPELDPPLVERIDVPDHALREDAVLVERDQRPERLRRELLREDHRRRPVALERPGRHEA